MDEYNQGWDPDVKQFFRKILNSFGAGVFWLLTFATAGIFFRLAFVHGGWRWYNVLFYILFTASLALLVAYLYRLWGKKE